MTRNPITLREDDSVRLGGLTLLRHGISGAPVTIDDGTLVGVFSQTDVLARFAAPRQRRGPIARVDNRHANAETVGAACTRPPAVIGPDATVDTAAREMLDRDIGRLIVIEDNKVVGVVSRSDILKLFLPDRDPSRETTTDQPGPLLSMDPD
jgi:CBS domain-containing protein